MAFEGENFHWYRPGQPVSSAPTNGEVDSSSANPHRQIFQTASPIREWLFKIACAAVFAFAVLSIGIVAVRTIFPPDLDASYRGAVQSLDLAEPANLGDDRADPQIVKPAAGSPLTFDPAKIDSDGAVNVHVPPMPESGMSVLPKSSWIDASPNILTAGFSIEGIPWLRNVAKQRRKRPATFIFLGDGDAQTTYSLGRNLVDIDYLIPAWLHVDKSGNLLIDPADEREWLADALDEYSIVPKILPSLDNAGEAASAAIGRFLSGDEQARQSTQEKIIASLEDMKAAGVAFDLEHMGQADLSLLKRFLLEFSVRLHEHKMLLVVRAPLADAENGWKRATASADYVVLVDRSDRGGFPTIIPEDRSQLISNELGRWIAARPADRVVFQIPGPSYLILNGGRQPSPLSFDDAIRALQANPGVRIRHLGMSLGNFRTDDSSGGNRRYFVQDAATVYNLLLLLGDAGVSAVALQGLGEEDPATWRLLTTTRKGESLRPDPISEVRFAYPFRTVGRGEVFTISGAEKSGVRQISQDAEGRIVAEWIESFPAPSTATRWGGAPSKKVVLTFDDGPDWRYTPFILDVLKQYDVPAAFFVVGGNVLKSADIVRRMVEEGHEVGNHTFSHPDLGRLSDFQMELELAGTQRVLESTIGRNTLLFRAPYAADESNDSGFKQTEVSAKVSKLGYLMVDMYVDPEDWHVSDSDVITDRVVGAVESNAGHVILLHDAGGDRSGTIAALPRIITRLRNDGYEFTSIAGLLGLSSSVLMPLVKLEDNSLRMQNAGIDFLRSATGWISYALLAAIVLGMTRIAVIMGLAALPRRRPCGEEGFRPSASVVIPAFNEEKVVLETVRSILKSDYADLEIIVVDDGSTDSTLAVLQKTFNDTEIQIFTKPNGGKASALNYGIRFARGDVIVSLDADTIYQPDTIRLLIQRFADHRVGAVAGNAKVGNRGHLLTQLQALEYITAQNLDRRAFESIGGITVVPGAVGAWRRVAIDQAGGYSSNTVAEDADLTIALLRNGWKVVYAPEAIAYTEAPETLSGLVRQRRRWAFGTLQNLWKHRHAFMEPHSKGLCFIAFPHMAIFQFILPVLAPVADAAFVIALFSVGVHKWFHPELPVGTDTLVLLQSYLLFSLVDMAAAIAAFVAERREQTRLLFLIPLQRLMYRQILYYVLLKALAAAIRGRLARWEKLERTATVTRT